MRAEVGCDDGLYTVEIGADAEEDELLERDEDGAVSRTRPLELTPTWAAGQALDVDAGGATIVLLLDRKPPLLISRDSGTTWSERGAGLPGFSDGRSLPPGRRPAARAVARLAGADGERAADQGLSFGRA